MTLSEVTEKLALSPLNPTAVAPVKLEPEMVTVVPAGPEVGENLEITGGLTTVKLFALVAVPAGVLTLIGPLVPPDGTVA